MIRSQNKRVRGKLPLHTTEYYCNSTAPYTFLSYELSVSNRAELSCVLCLWRCLCTVLHSIFSLFCFLSSVQTIIFTRLFIRVQTFFCFCFSSFDSFTFLRRRRFRFPSNRSHSINTFSFTWNQRWADVIVSWLFICRFSADIVRSMIN